MSDPLVSIEAPASSGLSAMPPTSTTGTSTALVRLDGVAAAAMAGASDQGDVRRIGVREDRLDAVIDLLGELGNAGTAAATIARQMGRADLIEALDQVTRLVEAVSDGALRLRRTTLVQTFERLCDQVRATAARRGLEVDLNCRGADTELDVRMVDAMTRPLEALVRDVLGLDLEPGTVGEPPQRACLALSAGVEGGSVVLRIAGDGRPATADEPAAMRPGLTGARRAVEALRGTLAVTGAQGHPTTVEIRLPLNHALVDGFLVGIGSSRFIVPLEAVVEVIERRAAASDLDGRGRGVVDLRGRPLPVVSLRALYSLDSPEPDRSSVVVIQASHGRFGVMVDRLYGRHQSVIKPLGPLLGSLRGLSGSSVLGGGDVALIFDIGALEQLVSHASHTATLTEGTSA